MISQVIAILRAIALAWGLNANGFVAVSGCETGLTYKPTIQSPGGYYSGLFQLGPTHLRRFAQWGYDDWADPQQMGEYTARYVTGNGTHEPNWSEWGCGWKYYRYN